MRNGACISKIEPSDYEYDDDMNLVLNLGDVLINLEAAGQQSETYGHSFERETAFLLRLILFFIFLAMTISMKLMRRL